MDSAHRSSSPIPSFDRKFFTAPSNFTMMGTGSIGGKAQGLAFINKFLDEKFSKEKFSGFEVSIPRLTVIGTDVFAKFMERNDLYEAALSGQSDDRIAYVFQKAEFPTEYLGDLLALISEVHTPLAIRSSSLLEDALEHPFAGVYATKMIPNFRLEAATRFHRLLEAIKFVYASTFFREARAYIEKVGEDIHSERMGVIVQEVVGSRYSNRFYPTLAGVGRSYNYYPIGKARPENGVVNLALGLGKTIVDGGVSWAYSPAFPKLNPPFANSGELMKNTQTKFWAVNMGQTAVYDPTKEDEYMISETLESAEADDTLNFTASTYNAASDRIYPGIGSEGPRIINFAPILINRTPPLNDVINELLKISREAAGAEVEIEFAVDLNPKNGIPARLGFLQVRPMAASSEVVDIDRSSLSAEKVLIDTPTALGNGKIESIYDIVYVKPDSFNAKFTRLIANEVDAFNRRLVNEKKNYLLIGFGRWGSSDPWLGIPVYWSQISGAKVIVESTLPEMNVELSQGSHFFHNLTSFGVPYFTVKHTSNVSKIDWDWLTSQKIVSETELIRHIHLTKPITVLVNGRQGEGVILHD